jgi:DNA helicase-2/ATP-dependent DNA helicase PcrA
LLLEQASHLDSLEDFMQESMLEMSQAEAAQGIQVLTIHASKGLEFDHVTLPFWVEGIMPHARALRGTTADIEEERRLAYVAITRARESVQVTSSVNSIGVTAIRDERLKPSRFLDEILAAPEDTRRDMSRARNGNVYPTQPKGFGSTRPYSPPAAPAPRDRPRENANPMARLVAQHAAKREADNDTEPAF